MRTSESELIAEMEVANAAGMHMLAVMDHTGDNRIMWDPRDKGESEVAKAAFDAAKAKGMVAYKVSTETGERTREVVTRFDKKLGKLIMVPQLVGG